MGGGQIFDIYDMEQAFMSIYFGIMTNRMLKQLTVHTNRKKVSYILSKYRGRTFDINIQGVSKTMRHLFSFISPSVLMLQFYALYGQ